MISAGPCILMLGATGFIGTYGDHSLQRGLKMRMMAALSPKLPAAHTVVKRCMDRDYASRPVDGKDFLPVYPRVNYQCEVRL